MEQGADVNAHDKGGLIPLHNAASYGHLDLAALLIKYNTDVNATDNWDYTPLHEAAQKGRTQLSALLVSFTNFLIQYIPYLKFSSLDTNLLLFDILTIYILSNMLFQLAHGADPFFRNQDRQTPLDLVTAEDVRSLLTDAMAAHPSSNSDDNSSVSTDSPAAPLETVVMPSGASVALPNPKGTCRSFLLGSQADGSVNGYQGAHPHPNCVSLSTVQGFLER